jgi:hypothetical protein
LLLAGSLGVANATTTDLEPPLNSNIPLDTEQYVSPSFNVQGPLSGTYDLIVRYGIWDGGGASQQVDISFYFDNTLVGTVDSKGAYYSDPQWVTYNVTSLVQAGDNVLSVEGIDASSAGSHVTSFAVGPPPAATVTPLPAALPLFAGGLGAMGVLGWRRKRRTRATA